MGYTRWSSDAYDFLKRNRAGSRTDELFTNNKNRRASKSMLPTGVKFRESRDSEAHPESLSIAVFLDVTGSMGRIPEILVREKLGSLMDTMISHGIAHPQVLFGGIGDHHCDSFPLQVGQFESGTRELDKWLTALYLEGGGGGQIMESYSLAWLFCARHTSLDCYKKRGEKGFLFTIGDEANWNTLEADKLKRIMGYNQAADVSDVQLLEEVQASYHVFHIHVNEAYYRDNPKIIGYWKKLLGERCIVLDDYNAIAETIASTVGILNGLDLDDILNSFDRKTAETVGNALIHVKNADSSLLNRVSPGIYRL